MHHTEHATTLQISRNRAWDIFSQPYKNLYIFPDNREMDLLEESDTHQVLKVTLRRDDGTHTSIVERELNRHRGTIAFSHGSAGLPDLLKSMRGEWRVFPLGNDQTQLVMAHDFELVDMVDGKVAGKHDYEEALRKTREDIDKQVSFFMKRLKEVLPEEPTLVSSENESMETPRRIVTGHDKDGRSVILSDGEPPHIIDFPDRGLRFIEYWATDESPVRLSPQTSEPTQHKVNLSPAPHGTLLRILEVQPKFTLNNEAIPLVHRTETLDYGLVIQGEVALIMDDSEIMLKVGDVVIQNGTRHAFFNKSNRVARIAFILLSAEFSPTLKEIIGESALKEVIKEA